MNHYLSHIFSLSFIMTTATVLAGPAEDMLAAAQPTSEGLVAMADKAKNTPATQKDKKPTLDPVAFEALILAYKDAKTVNTDFFRFNIKSPVEQAMIALRKKYNFPNCKDFIDRLLANENPLIRAKAVTLLAGGLLGNSQDSINKVKALIPKEKDPAVLAAIITTFANNGGRDEAIGQFLVKCLDNTDSEIRRSVVVFSTSSWNFKTPGLSEKIAELMLSEKDPKVRMAFIERAGKLGKDCIYESYAKILDSDATVDIKKSALSGMITMWWYFPLYNTYCQKAYAKTIDFLSKLQDNADAKKYLSALRDLSQHSSSARTIETYTKNAPWYVAADVKKVLLPLVEFKNVDVFPRTTLLKALSAHGATKEEVTAIVQKLTSAEGIREFEKKQYEQVLSKLK